MLRDEGTGGRISFPQIWRVQGRISVSLCRLVIVLFVACPLLAQAPAPARRIVSLVPAVTEMLFAMGAGPDVVGVSSYDNYPPEVKSRPQLGALLDPDFERLLTLKPDLVIVYGTQSSLITRLDRVHVPYFSYEHAGLADIPVTMRRLGERIGRREAGNAAAAKIDADLEKVRRRVGGRPRPRTVLLFGREPGALRGMYASAGVGFLHDLLVTAGGDDVFAGEPRQSLQVSTEVLLARAPDVIIELRPSEGWTQARLDSERAVWRALPSLPAVRTNRIYILADDQLLVPGPRVGVVASRLADVLHPETK